MLRLPLDENTPGRRVNIIGGILANRSGHIDALSDEPQPSSVLVELDRGGAKVWIEVDHLEDEPSPVTAE